MGGKPSRKWVLKMSKLRSIGSVTCGLFLCAFSVACGGVDDEGNMSMEDSSDTGDSDSVSSGETDGEMAAVDGGPEDTIRTDDEDQDTPRREYTLDDAPLISGNLTEEWANYCTATFDEDHVIVDIWGDPELAIAAGETFLVSSMDGFFGTELISLSEAGPDDFELDDDAPVRFSEGCSEGSSVGLQGAFTDVTVYTTVALDEVACEIPAGTVVPTVGRSGLALAGSITFDGPVTYQVFIDSFSQLCPVTAGYIVVPETTVRGVRTWLTPIAEVQEPSAP